MNANIKKAVTKYAKQDLKIAKTKGMVTVCQCKVFGEQTNVTISRVENGLFDIVWGRMAENSWKNCNEELVIGFMMDAYQVEVA
jgi:hypothetical protein